MTRQLIVDLFAGPRPGGWDVGARLVGLEQPIGLEWDEGACNTRRAAGHLTIRADVAAYPVEPFGRGEVEGLIASPPCQEFSAANSKRRGLDSDRGALVWQVMRWAEALRPRWIACEQVPPVLPIWQAFAVELAHLGYRARACVLNAADYGVPQTRQRAILIAHRDRVVLMPDPTHSRTGHGRRRWVTMADALGWGHGLETPIPTRGAKPSEWVGTRLVNTGRDWKPGGTRADAQTFDPATRPAVAVTGKTSGQWAYTRPATTAMSDACICPPGHHDDRQPEGTIKVTNAELGVLQGFPADYPWRGPRIGQQVGNAVPPPLAAAVLEALVGES